MRGSGLGLTGLLALWPLPVAAIDVTFNGSVTDTCTLALVLPAEGTMRLNGDGTILGSDQGGIPVSVTIVSLGTNNITLDAPELTQAPNEYDESGQSVELSYAGTVGLTVVNRGFQASGGTIPASLISTAATLVVGNRIVNANGFAQGNYETSTTITCH
jgi:hypothetical protein